MELNEKIQQKALLKYTPTLQSDLVIYDLATTYKIFSLPYVKLFEGS